VVGEEPVEPAQVAGRVGGHSGVGLAAGGGLDRRMDLVADLGGVVALGEGGLLDLADRLAGGQQPEVVEMGDGVLGGDLGRPADQQRFGHAAGEDRGHTRELAALPVIDPMAAGADGGEGWNRHPTSPPR
jgi:hypothetical protein